MTQEEKQLLLKDLCARLPYGVKMLYSEEFPKWFSEIYGKGTSVFIFVLSPDILAYTITELNRVKPYLRPMSSMTYEEMQDAREKFFDGSDHYDIDDIGEIYADTYQPYTTVYTLSFARLSGYIDWLNSNHFDYRGLIEKGLALEAPEEMYKTK